MFNIFLTLSTIVFFTFSSRSHACEIKEILYIPNEYDYYLEPVVLSGDKYGLTTPIIGEECGHIYKSCSKRRRRNSQVSRTSKYCLFFYADRDKILNTEKQCFDVQTAIYKAGVKIKRTAEYELRSSIQFLLRNGELSQLFLSHPLIQYEIRQRIPLNNSKLLSTVEATNVACFQSKAAISFKLKIPKVEKMLIKVCTSYEIYMNSGYLYYESATSPFRAIEINTNKCLMESFIFCPPESIREINCIEENSRVCSFSDISKVSDSFQLLWIFPFFISICECLPSKYILFMFHAYIFSQNLLFS
ncbi:Insulin/EGF-Receptor L Domain protein [Caenorhabditis elegans]|uniref:Insulin/EGF-Receptor L Domain protein n=1 Tax=Caenorhabditis elegans TaxID=6239 RepID=Q5FC53_CAEEL|nr:Insulin/EGF-Receptor L Domain protein [Caenorhabditis elegans]CAI46600.4 Insulin/EGF-Receptor L Domain protein [Caenorhabditis elegans]|eukprot:NP_001023806.4 Uncharacterized protein CELE_F15H10.10 [Caenorhabditis elegans]